MFLHCCSRLIHRLGRHGCVVQVRFLESFRLLRIYSCTALVIYSCAGNAFALLFAVETLPRWTRLCRPEVLSLSFMIAVGIQLSRLIHRPERLGCVVHKCFILNFRWLLLYCITAQVMYSCTKDLFALRFAVDTSPRSTRLCRQEVRSLPFMIAVGIQLSRLTHRPGRLGCVIKNCIGLNI